MHRIHVFNERDEGRGHYAETQPLAWIARSLLILCAVSIVTMPLTQYLWAWDGFMHGGQDFELGALMVLTLLCLALLLPKLCKQSMKALFARCRRASRTLMYGARKEILAPTDISISNTKSVFASGVYNLPLQI